MLEKVRQHKNELWNWLTKQTYFQTRTPQNFYSKIIYLDLCLLWHIVEGARTSASASASVCVDGSSECSIMFCGVQYDASKCTFTEIASASTIPAPSKYSLTESKKSSPEHTPKTLVWKLAIVESRDSRAFVFVGSADEWGFRMIQNRSLLLLNFYFFFLVFVCAASLSSYLRCGSQYDVRYFSGFCLDKRETEIKKKRQRTCLCHCVSVSAWSVVTFFYNFVFILQLLTLALSLYLCAYRDFVHCFSLPFKHYNGWRMYTIDSSQYCPNWHKINGSLMESVSFAVDFGLC